MSEALLAIETSGRWTGVAVAEGSRVMAARQVETRNSHNEMLPGLVAEAMSEAGKDFCDLGVIGVSIGPGSFTALRIGLLYAAGIAFAHCVKIVPVMTLDVLNACLNVEDGVRLPLMDAYKGEVFTAPYKGYSRTGEVVIIKPSRLNEFVRTGKVYVFGPAFGKYEEEILHSLGDRAILQSAEIKPDPVALAGLTYERRSKAQEPAALQPFYMRKPDAKLPRR